VDFFGAIFIEDTLLTLTASKYIIPDTMSTEQYHPERGRSVFPIENGPPIFLENEGNMAVKLSWSTQLSADQFLRKITDINFDEEPLATADIYTSPKFDDQQRIDLRPKQSVRIEDIENFHAPSDIEVISVYLGSESIAWERQVSQDEEKAKVSVTKNNKWGITTFSFPYFLTTGVELTFDQIGDIMHDPKYLKAMDY